MTVPQITQGSQASLLPRRQKMMAQHRTTWS